jgi:hypothetical protein
MKLQTINKKITTPFCNQIRFAFIKSPYFLEQYYEIRKLCYRKHLGLKTFSGEEEKEDICGDIVLATRSNECLGGARLVISSKNNRVRLALEKDDWRLEDYFPNLHLCNYGEISRLCVKPEYQKLRISQTLFSLAINKAIQGQCKYLFFHMPVKNLPRFQYTFNNLGLSLTTILDIKQPHNPQCEHLKMCMTKIDLPTRKTQIINSPPPSIQKLQIQLQNHK